MADKHITTPTTWISGTTVTPTWLQQVQDNTNGLFDGTRTVKSLFIDASGGQDTSIPAGYSLVTTGNMHTTGNSVVDGYITAATSLGASGAVFDGYGGTAGVYVSGAVTVAATAGGTSYPTPTFHRGILYKDTAVLAWGCVNNNGTASPPIYYGVNIASVSRAGTGSLTITLNTGATSTNLLCISITCVGENRVGCASPISSTSFGVLTSNGQTAPSGGRVDTDFMFIVFGG